MTARTLAHVGRHFCEACHITDSTDSCGPVADGFGIYFAIYPKDSLSCSALFEQKHFVPVSTVLGQQTFHELVASQDKFITSSGRTTGPDAVSDGVQQTRTEQSSMLELLHFLLKLPLEIL